MLVKRAIVVGLFAVGGVSSSHAFGSDDKWTAGWGQGIAEAIVTKGPGNEIYVTCDEGAGQNATGISFMLAGKGPTGDSVLLAFDNADPEEYSIWDGKISSSCHACASVYTTVAEKLRNHSSVHVRFQNGDAGRFTLRGSSEAIGTCEADFYR